MDESAEQLETPFNDMGTSPEVGASIMNTLQLSRSDLDNHQIFSKLTQVVDFLGQFEGGSVDAMVTRITAGKFGEEKLDHLFEFVAVKKDLMSEMEGFEDLEKEFTRKRGQIALLQDTLKRLEQ